MKNATEEVRKWYGSRWEKVESNSAEKLFDSSLVSTYNMVSDKVVLNLGCYYPVDELILGPLSKLWIAIDFCPEVIEHCKEVCTVPQVNFQLADMRTLPFENETFDTVFDFSSGDHVTLEDYDKVLKQVWKVLKPYGIFLVTYSNIDFYADGLAEYTDYHGYERRIKPDDLAVLLMENGFKIEVDKRHNIRSGFILTKQYPFYKKAA